MPIIIIIKQFLKILLIEIIRSILHIFYIFPVQNEMILFSAYWKAYCCNPKYIYEYLNRIMKKNITYVWVGYNIYFNSGSKTIFVKPRSFKCIYYLLISQIIITNDNYPSWIPFRKNQVIINTWHGGGAYKSIGIDNKETKDYYSLYVIKRIGFRTNYFISSSKIFSELISKELYIDQKKFLPIGMPRNDIFFRTSINAEEIKKKIGIHPSTSIILYAPTYRGNSKFNKSIINDIQIDFEKVINSCNFRFNTNFLLLYRSHHVMKNVSVNNDSLINVTDYHDMQELLYIADILITDYSSCMWDFSLTYRPGFLYIPDVHAYNDQRGLCTPVSEWPFGYAITNEQLCANIENFNENENIMKIKKHHSKLGSYEHGNSTFILTELINDILK